MPSLVQFRVEDEVKAALARIFERDGLTTTQGMKILAYQIAQSGRSPFMNAFTQNPNRETRRAIDEARAFEQSGLPDTRPRYDSARSLMEDILDEEFA
jgi:addiction module RelB/DinJ family antitoxin